MTDESSVPVTAGTLHAVNQERERAEVDAEQSEDLLAAATQRVQELTQRVREVEGELEAQKQATRGRLTSSERLSFKSILKQYQATYKAAVTLSRRGAIPMLLVNYKLRSYAFARSHGVETPQVYAVWYDVDGIDLSTVEAERIVLKSDGGHSAKGVWPLVRMGDVWTSLDGKTVVPNGPLPDEMKSALKGLRGPFFAEELLERPSGPGVPADVKLYMSYGEVLQVLVMEPAESGSMDRHGFTRRFFDEAGNDLGRIVQKAAYTPSTVAPEPLPEMVEIARHLSVAVGLPFVRVDLYSTSRGVVLGELTLVPGGRQVYQLDHEQRMAEKWALGQARLDRDLSLGRPAGTWFGPHPFEWHYRTDNLLAGKVMSAVEGDSCGPWCTSK